MTGVVIRRGEVDDLDAIIGVYESVAAEGLWIGGEVPVEWPPERIDAWHEQLSADDRTGAGFVAVVDDDLVGWIGLQRDRVGHADFGMAIRDGSRGQGLGGRLVDVAVEWATDLGLSKVTLQVWPHNTAAIRLYLTRGFVIEGRLRRHWRRRSGELWDSVLMGRVLDVMTPGSVHPDSPLLIGTPAG